MRKLRSWQKILLAGAGLIVPILSCSQRSLVLIDVHAPQGVAYSNVTVIITPNREQPTTFDKVTFDASGVFKAGVYLPSDMTGTVALHGDVNDESNCMVGSGDVSTTVASQGETTMVVALPIVASSAPCIPGTGGSTGAGGAAGTTASGGSGGPGGLTGTAGSGVGTGGLGAGGVTGNAGAPGTGQGGVTGAGGANATGGHGGPGSGGVTGAGGSPTGAGGSPTGAGGSPTTGAGGSPTTGVGGSPTTGAGGSPTTGAGGSPTTGTGGTTGKGGTSGTTGAGGTGAVTGAGGVIGTGGGGGCACPTNFVCMPGTTVCVCSQTDAEACASVACGSTTNLCQQSVSCPNTCPVGYSCVGNFCRQLTTTGCGGDIVATGTGLVAGSSAAPPVCQ